MNPKISALNGPNPSLLGRREAHCQRSLVLLAAAGGICRLGPLGYALALAASAEKLYAHA